MLRADNVTFAYDASVVLRNVSVAIGRGSIVGILGPNGSGKTTLLRVLAGVLVPSSGRVVLGDQDLLSIPRRALARRIAVVPQETHLTFDYRVIELALMGRYPYLGAFEFEGPEDVEAALRALDATGTRPLAQRSVGTLSGGERQRVIIASALAQFEDVPRGDGAGAGRAIGYDEGPRVLLLDEPTASLDVRYQLEIASLLKHLLEKRALSIVVSTHDLNFAATVCSELVLLRDGAVIDAGPTASVLKPSAVRALYGIEAEVTFHAAAGHLTVVPLSRPSPEGSRPV